jgi:hypothetical protein
MTGSTDTHDAHGDHPVSASIVGLLLVAVFVALFAAMSTKTFDAMVAIVAVLLAGWTLVSIWALDGD